MQNRQYYVTATVENRKIYIPTEDIKHAFAVQKDLFNHKTLEIMNVRQTKYKPKTKSGYIQIESISEIEDSIIPLI